MLASSYVSLTNLLYDFRHFIINIMATFMMFHCQLEILYALFDFTFYTRLAVFAANSFTQKNPDWCDFTVSSSKSQYQMT